MQCQYCASELQPNATECKQCGALRVVRRTTLGVFVGWAGMVVGITWIMLLVPLTFLPFLGYDMGSYPWITLIVGALTTAALLWYSRTTMHVMWVRPGE
ncbi:MAG: hypothetical protein WCA64_12950 [Gallionella sp.]